MIDYFLVDITHNVFYVDSDEYAQPMTYYVERPIDIDFEFISIASEKGLLAYLVYVKLNRATKSIQ